MRKIILLSTTCLTLALPQTVNADIHGAMQAGYDTNPFRLNSALAIEEAVFQETEIRLVQDLAAGFGVDIRANHLNYSQEADDGDVFTLSAAVNAEMKGSLLDREAKYSWRVKYTDQDKTYVSRVTGAVGSFGETPTPDRYDADWFDARARVDVKLDDKFTLKLEMELRDKSYEDYTAVGLSNLDYEQAIALGELRFRPDKVHDFRVGADYRVRAYDDREGRQLDGSTWDDSELQYDFWNVDLSWKYKLDDARDLKATYSYEIREDDVSGYYDTTRHDFGLRYRQKLSDHQRFTGKVGYTDYQYDNLVLTGDLEGDEPVGPKKGYKFSLSYDHALKQNDDSELWLVAGVSRGDYDSDNLDYTFDRNIFFVGLEGKF